jgi:hypothetical protein
MANPIERRMELAFRPGSFIPDGASFSFVSGLEEVAAEIRTLAGTEPARATSLYETFLAGCHEKADEVDDSSGSFGQFAGGLMCSWIDARQAAGASPEDTVSKLLAWMDDDPYGFSSDVEKNAAKVFDQAGLAEFERRIRARFEAAAQQGRDRPAYLRKHWGGILRTIYLARQDIAAYVALTDETELTPSDCLSLATLLVSLRKPGEALAWVDRGIDLDRKTPYGSGDGYGLSKLRRELLAELGRGNEALDAAWADFRKAPSKYAYEELMRFVPAADRAAWHEKALDAAAGADLHTLIDLLVETGETGRLADLIRGASDGALERVSHYATEPAATKLEKDCPDLAARLWRAQGMRILNAKKSRYYDAALSNFERAKNCYQRAGLVVEWQETVRQVRSNHRRKIGFMPGFERLASGSGRVHPPSFLERAQARWNRPGGDLS